MTAIMVSQTFSYSSPIKSPPEMSLGINWQPVANDPQLTGGACFSWRCAGVGDPAIQWAANGSLYLWFTSMGIREKAPGEFVAEGPWGGRAVGSEKHLPILTVSPEHPILSVGSEGAWDRYIETPDVLLDPKTKRWDFGTWGIPFGVGSMALRILPLVT